MNGWALMVPTAIVLYGLHTVTGSGLAINICCVDNAVHTRGALTEYRIPLKRTIENTVYTTFIHI